MSRSIRISLIQTIINHTYIDGEVLTLANSPTNYYHILSNVSTTPSNASLNQYQKTLSFFHTFKLTTPQMYILSKSMIAWHRHIYILRLTFLFFYFLILFFRISERGEGHFILPSNNNTPNRSMK